MDNDAENAKIGGNDSQVSNCSAIFSQETHRYLLKDLYDFASTLLSQGDTNCVATQYQVHGSEVESDMQYTTTLPRSQGFLRHEELNIHTDSYTIRPEYDYENYTQQGFIPPTQDSSNFNGQENIPFCNFQNTLLTHVKPDQPLYPSQFSQNSNENYILKDFNLNDPINNLCNLESPTHIKSEFFPHQQLLKQATTPRNSAVNSNPKILRDLPSNVPLPGQYGFQFVINEINEKNANKKAISYTFSADKNKLYIRINETCPINFKVGKIPPAQSCIRATAIYSKPQDLGDAVKRCMTHVDKDKAEKIDRVTTLTSVADPAPKRRMFDDAAPSSNGPYQGDDSEIFTVRVRGRELYKIVQTIVQNFEIARNVSELAALRSTKNVVERRVNGRTTPPSSPLSSVRISGGGDDENNETKTPKQQNCTILKRQNSQQQQNLEQLIGKLSQEKKFCGSSPISSWLETMSMQKYIPNLESNGLHQMDQLKDVSHERLRSIGIEDGKDLDRLYESIIRFKLTCEFGESFGYSTSQQGIGPGGLHISRTTVKHSYKFDTGEN